jgi:hypothetical protein
VKCGERDADENGGENQNTSPPIHYIQSVREGSLDGHEILVGVEYVQLIVLLVTNAPTQDADSDTGKKQGGLHRE